jgi:hypothetical protein
LQFLTAQTDEDRRRCFPVMDQFRQQLIEDTFLAQVHRQSEQHGCTLVFVQEGHVCAVAALTATTPTASTSATACGFPAIISPWTSPK